MISTIPRLLYGTAWKAETTAHWVTQAIQAGFRGIDTACQPKHYNEAGVGQALQQLHSQGITRDLLFLQTKFTPLAGHDPLRIPYDPEAPLATQVRQSFTNSQKNLNTEYVDSLVLHSPLTKPAELMEVWHAMEKIHQDGHAKQLGISNCYDLAILMYLYDNATIKPTIVQNRFYQDTHYDQSLRAWCKDKYLCYQSFWTLTANPHVLASTTLREISVAHQKTEAQIFFRYVTQLGIVPLIGSRTEQHIKEDLAIFDFELQADELQAINHLLQY